MMALFKVLNIHTFPVIQKLMCSATVVYSSKCMNSSLPTVIENSNPINEYEAKDLPDWNMDNPFKEHKQVCILCRLNITPDYKNVKLLSQFVSRFTGKVYGRHITRLCKRQQEAVEKEIRKAQWAGLMSGYFKDMKFAEDPKLFNPERPLRPHRF